MSNDDLIADYIKILNDYYKYSADSPFNDNHKLYINYEMAIDFIKYVHGLNPQRVNLWVNGNINKCSVGPLLYRMDLCDYHAKTDNLQSSIFKCSINVAPVTEVTVYSTTRGIIYNRVLGVRLVSSKGTA